MRGAEQPFLFFPEGPDIRWRAFAAVAEQAAAGRRALEELGLEPGAVVGYTWHCGPDAVAADLAIRSGGWTAAPLPALDRGSGSEGASPPDRAARLLLPFETGAVGSGGATAGLPPAGSELGRRGAGPDLPGGGEPAGDALLREPGRGSGGWRRVGPERVAAAAEDLDRALAAAACGSRPVVAAWLDPAEPAGRVVLAWAVAARAALYLEPDPRVLGGAASWVRPTVVAGDAWALATVMAELRRWAERRRRRAGRWSWLGRLFGLGADAGGSARPGPPPWGRLRAVVVSGPGDLAPEDHDVLAELGLAVVRPVL